MLTGCGSIETKTTKEYTEELSIIEAEVSVQVEQNATPSIIKDTTNEETNHNEIEIVDTQYSEPEQNHTTEISQLIEIPAVNEIEDVAIVIEEEIDYTKKFINEENCHQILDKEFLTICYDFNLKVAKSVGYTLYGDLVNELNIKERPSFYTEKEIESEYRANRTDYTNTGYDRGHLAPDAGFDWSQESLDSTYSLANIIPQVPIVNRHMWVKAEKYARDKAVELFELNILNVIKYNSTLKQIGENRISVPIGYYKILFNSDEKYEECFYYANDVNVNLKNDQLKNHTVNCADI